MCEATDGDGLGNPGTETLECIEGGRDEITDGCDLPDMNVYLGNNGEVYYNSLSEIGGFLFNIDGTTITGASGGDAQSAGLMISTSSTMVIAFSLAGSSVPPGCGTLVNLDLAGEATGLSNLVFSDAIGGQIPIVYYVPAEDPDLVADWTDEYPDCAANILDCAGEWDGDAVIDE